MENVSVIIPTWNRKKTLRKAIKSALSQTLSVFEVLVCDDGSTDDTYQAIKSIKDKRVKWISGKHTGLPAVVRNRGIKRSKGDWIAFLDSDDWWEKDKLEKQLELVKKLQVKAVCSNACVVNFLNGKKERLYFSKAEVKDVFGFNELLATNLIICSSFIGEKNLIIESGGFPEDPKLKAIEDYALWLRLSTKTKIAYCSESLVRYSNDPDNSIRRVCNDVKLQKKAVLKNFLKWSFQKLIYNRKQIAYIIFSLMKYAKEMVIL